MKRLIIVFFLILSYKNAFAQREISITTNGIGLNEENAVQNCIVSSINEIFGIFYSSFTLEQGDSLIIDDFAKINHGNIKDLKINSSEKINNDKWFVSLSLKISLIELEKFYTTSSRKVNYEGNLYYFNIQLQKFNEINEYKSISNILEVCNDILLNSFSYEFKVSDPISMDDLSENWLINFKINSMANSNITILKQLVSKNLKGLNMSESEITDYNTLGKKVYELNYISDSSTLKCTLRNEYSFDIFNTFIRSWEGYVRSFDIRSKLSLISGNSISSKEYFKAINNDEKYFNDIKILNISNINENLGLDFYFPNIDSICGSFSFYKKFILKDIENTDGYSVMPNNKMRFKFGGYIISENNGHGIILSPFKISYKQYNAGIKPIIPEFGKWKVPTFQDYKIICDNIYANHFFGFKYNDEFLTSTRGSLSIISIMFNERGEFSSKRSSNNSDDMFYDLNPKYYISPNETSGIAIDWVLFVKKF